MKNTPSPIHPELRKAFQRTPKVTYTKWNLWLIKWVMRLMPTPRPPQDILIENVFVPRQDGRTSLRLRIYQSKSTAASAPMLLWLHGGGYVMGKPEQDDIGCSQFVRLLGLSVLSVDYRCAPEHPFPAGLEDGYSALKWAAGNARNLRVDPGRIAVGGASAGGGLAASLIQLAHDRQEIMPAFQLLVYPMLDDRTALCAEVGDPRYLTWNPESNRFGWECYLGRKCGAEDAAEYSVPARRRNLSGLPPAWIGVGNVDLFHAEDLAYAQRLKDAGVACETCIVPGAFHGFDMFDPEVPVVQGFRKSQVDALRRGLFVMERSLPN